MNDWHIRMVWVAEVGETKCHRRVAHTELEAEHGHLRGELDVGAGGSQERADRAHGLPANGYCEDLTRNAHDREMLRGKANCLASNARLYVKSWYSCQISLDTT